ncbi:Hypothetical protein CINCED_3A000476 [Cinara cedri]|uniref:Uncharacterized protein n=1 Tax=Cinara cedri TaxID=506608 RepID=A0A5E4N7F1_9HEMI|nr:Hypothetical protein CINCED_3A000476 [Cinara cedri]
MELDEKDDPDGEVYKQLMEATRNGLPKLRKIINEWEYLNIQKRQVGQFEALYNMLDTKKLCDVQQWKNKRLDIALSVFLEDEESLEEENCRQRKLKYLKIVLQRTQKAPIGSEDTHYYLCKTLLLHVKKCSETVRQRNDSCHTNNDTVLWHYVDNQRSLGNQRCLICIDNVLVTSSTAELRLVDNGTALLGNHSLIKAI